MKKYFRTEYLFAFTGIVILILGLLFYHSTFDIAIHDTYFVIGHSVVAMILFSFCLFFASVYFLFRSAHKPLQNILGFIHYLFTFLPLIIPVLINTSPHRYHPGDDMSAIMEDDNKLIIFLAIAIVLCGFGQAIFLINIIAALFRKKGKA